MLEKYENFSEDYDSLTSIQVVYKQKNMAISEFEIKKCEKDLEAFMVKYRPPAHIRNEVDFSYCIENQSVEIFEVRPHWKNPSEKTETPIAKATYIKAKKVWKIYWQKSDLKWHLYEPLLEVKTLEQFLNVVGEDEHSCFFG